MEHRGMSLEWDVADAVKADEVFRVIWRLACGDAGEVVAGIRRKATPELLAEVASAYLSAPVGKKIGAVRELVGGETADAAYYINAARGRGLIPRTKQGRRGRPAEATDGLVDGDLVAFVEVPSSRC